MKKGKKKRREGDANPGEKMPAIVWVVPHDYRPDLGDNAFDNFAAFHTPERAEDYRSHQGSPEPIAYVRLTKKAAEALRATSAAQAVADLCATKRGSMSSRETAEIVDHLGELTDAEFEALATGSRKAKTKKAKG